MRFSLLDFEIILMNMNSSTQTRLAILGTMAVLHTQPIRYDISGLRKLVADVSPDLLCVEITQRIEALILGKTP